MPIITGPAGMDPVLGEMRTIDISGSTGGGGDYTFNTSEFIVSISNPHLVSLKEVPVAKVVGAVTGIDASVTGNTATIAATGSTTSVKLVGIDGTTVSEGENGDIQIGGGGGSLDGEIASVDEVMTGITGGTTAVVDVSALRGALTAGQAVDVTSRPDGVTGDYRDTFSWTDLSLGFDNSFPKYADGLNYLMIADLTYVGVVGEHILVSPSGTWLDGTKTAIRLDNGETKRVAMLFASRTAKLTADLSGIDYIVVSNLREYEVTACSNEAIAYIAALSNPDVFASYYLVKADMVQPWTYIIDMGDSEAVTIASGLSYKLNASTGTHQLTVDTCPAGYDGRDAIIRIRLGGTGVIQAIPPLQLGDALVPYAINNCVVRFRDGEAVLLVEDTLAGYVVTVTSGTDNGSLAYGLAATGVPYIAFSTGTDGSVVDMGNAVTANEEVMVVGNGYEDTTITGNITCTNKTTVANLSLQDVTVTGGTLTFGDAYIPSGSTVAVSGGRLAVEKVSGEGSESVIDLGGTNIFIPSAATAYVYGVQATSGSGSVGGAFNVSGTAHFESCVISGNVASTGGGIQNVKPVYLSDCIVSGNTRTGNQGRDIYPINGSADVVLLGGNKVGEIMLTNGAKVYMSGSNTVDSVVSRAAGTSRMGTVTIYSGAIVDLTGNTNATPIRPGLGVIVDGGCQVITSAGSTVSIAGGTYTKINNDGTTE